MAKAPLRTATDLREHAAAVRVSFTRMGVTRALTPDQKASMAEEFDADSRYLKASKRLLNSRAKAWKDVAGVFNEARRVWRAMTLPFPDPGVRLIRKDKVPAFEQRMASLREQLDAAVAELESALPEIKAEARDALGSLYAEGDYPASLQGLFGFAWEFPNYDPPSYLATLSPEAYERERERVAARFDLAAKQAEEMLLDELAKLVGSLCDSLAGVDDEGRPKQVKSDQVGKLRDFFQRFKDFDLSTNSALTDLVDRAQAAIGGASAGLIKTDLEARAALQASLGDVSEAIKGMIGSAPRARVKRPGKRSQGEAA